MNKQEKDRWLAVRAETAHLLAEAVEGHRQDVHIEASQLSRYCTDSATNPLAHLVLLVRTLPDERAAMLLGAVEDAYDEAHGEPAALSLAEALLKAGISDRREDAARERVAVMGASNETLRALIDRTYEEAHDGGLLRRVCRRELHRRFGNPIRATNPAWERARRTA